VDYSRAHLIPRADVEPSECSTAYPPVFEIWSGGTLLATLYRIGPTSWFGDEYLIIGETDGPPDGICHSLWRVFKGPYYWETEYSGLSTQLFFSPNGGTPNPISIVPVP
jgi:hypothetical protein